ncbi:Ig-like domain repeat protein [candidate division KSB1 bacterium]|nr:Ig-like domain repeat protein [candidate division KSB1 bacterium]
MKRYIFFALPLLLLFANCDDENPIEPVGKKPFLSDLTAPSSLYIRSDIKHIISVEVSDPQGIEDIGCVEVDIYLDQIIQRDTLIDSGSDGDIIPLDGVYTKSYTADFARGVAGEYTFVFKATDKAGNQSETLSHQLMVIDDVENTSPTISNVTAPDEIDTKNNLSYLITSSVNDAQGATDIAQVSLDIYAPTNTTPNFSALLYDDESNGDLRAGDGIYSYALSSKFSRNVIGKFTIRIQAHDKAGNSSHPWTAVIDVIQSDNDPPILFNLVAPDTMRLLKNKSALATLQISVSDPQGLNDVREVYFNSYKPDGSPSSGNPFKLLDDGDTEDNGDETANDGRYSIIISLPSNTPTGDYLFVFEAVDLQNFKSEPKEHVITVAN